jgi:hypothetical protein
VRGRVSELYINHSDVGSKWTHLFGHSAAHALFSLPSRSITLDYFVIGIYGRRYLETPYLEHFLPSHSYALLSCIRTDIVVGRSNFWAICLPITGFIFRCLIRMIHAWENITKQQVAPLDQIFECDTTIKWFIITPTIHFSVGW